MSIKIDKSKCIGCGTCSALCPECFELGNNQKAKVINQNCKSCDLKEVAEICAVDAIEVRE